MPRFRGRAVDYDCVSGTSEWRTSLDAANCLELKSRRDVPVHRDSLAQVVGHRQTLAVEDGNPPKATPPNREFRKAVSV